jgi:hypothetical protein
MIWFAVFCKKIIHFFMYINFSNGSVNKKYLINTIYIIHLKFEQYNKFKYFRLEKNLIRLPINT